MKAAKFDYLQPRALDEALRALQPSAAATGIKAMGGSQSFGPMLNLRLTRPRQVVDISLKGVLLQLPEGRTPTVGMPCLVKLPLSTSDVTIAMAGELAHVHGGQAGVLCRSIDLESITHLRRLIEVNLGDSTASERELKALIAAHALG